MSDEALFAAGNANYPMTTLREARFSLLVARRDWRHGWLDHDKWLEIEASIEARIRDIHAQYRNADSGGVSNSSP